MSALAMIIARPCFPACQVHERARPVWGDFRQGAVAALGETTQRPLEKCPVGFISLRFNTLLIVIREQLLIRVTMIGITKLWEVKKKLRCWATLAEISFLLLHHPVPNVLCNHFSQTTNHWTVYHLRYKPQLYNIRRRNQPSLNIESTARHDSDNCCRGLIC